jgi:hypothetical protein
MRSGPSSGWSDGRPEPCAQARLRAERKLGELVTTTPGRTLVIVKIRVDDGNEEKIMESFGLYLKV